MLMPCLKLRVKVGRRLFLAARVIYLCLLLKGEYLPNGVESWWFFIQTMTEFQELLFRSSGANEVLPNSFAVECTYYHVVTRNEFLPDAAWEQYFESSPSPGIFRV